MIRPRRLRENTVLREMLAQNHVSTKDLVYPLFVVEGKEIVEEIASMPQTFRFSVDMLLTEMAQLVALGIQSIILFGVVDDGKKDAVGSLAYSDKGIVPTAIRAIKENFPQVLVMADVCLCEYTDHGHCGLVENGHILNDQTLPLLAKTAVCYAKAGADVIAPSDMMDGRVATIRQALDGEGFSHISILSYSVKYASAFYGPFRDAAGSAPQFGDRKNYQMDYRNEKEAFREADLDIEEGADMLMVKPGMAYLDILYRLSERVTVPLAVYQVSGEYAMIKAAAQNGWIDEKKVVLESLTAFKRAGADIIITYYAKQVALWLEENK